MRFFLLRTTTLFSMLSMSAVAWAQQQGEPYYGPHMMWGGYYGMLLGPLMMILFIAVIVVLVMLAVRWRGFGSHGSVQHAPPSTKTPLDILKERFARGEIDKDEFEERRRVLGE